MLIVKFDENGENCIALMLPFVACQPSGQKAALARVGSEEWRCGSNRGQHRDFEDIELKAGHAEGTADRR